MRSLSRYYAFCTLFYLVSTPTLVLAAPDASCGDARPVFACELKGGGTLALCAQPLQGPLTGLQYRFARHGNTELQYPRDGYSLKDFKANHYTRYQVDHQQIRFTSGTYSYNVYSRYEGDGGQAQVNTAGVAVLDSADRTVADKQCARVTVDRLSEVLDQVPCDPDDALGCP